MSDGFRPLLVLLLGWLAAAPLAWSAAPPELRPADWKAATLHKVLSYVHWPEDAFAASTNKFVIGILGPDPFATVLDQLVKGVQIQGREVVVRKFTDPAEAAKCQVLFVPADQADAWRKAAPTSPRHLLVVGDSKDFAKSDGAFNLVFEKKKLEINPQAAARAGLKVDARLLKISDIIKGAEKERGQARDTGREKALAGNAPRTPGDAARRPSAPAA